jgi:hypothetical protein
VHKLYSYKFSQLKPEVHSIFDVFVGSMGFVSNHFLTFFSLEAFNMVLTWGLISVYSGKLISRLGF